MEVIHTKQAGSLYGDDGDDTVVSSHNSRRRSLAPSLTAFAVLIAYIDLLRHIVVDHCHREMYCPRRLDVVNNEETAAAAAAAVAAVGLSYEDVAALPLVTINATTHTDSL